MAMTWTNNAQGIPHLTTPGSDGDVADLVEVTKTLADAVGVKVAQVAPSVHDHTIAQVTGLQAALDAHATDAELAAVDAKAAAAQTEATAARTAARTAQDTADLKVAKAGDTMTGELVVRDAAVKSLHDGLNSVGMQASGSGYSQVVFYGKAPGGGNAAYWISTDPGAGGSLTIAQIDNAGNFVKTIAGFGPGGVYVTGGLTVAGQPVTPSSRRFKTDIADAGADVPDVCALTPATYVWRRDAPAPEGAGPRLGLIAEDVAAVDERLVWRDGDGQVSGLDAYALIAALVAKVQSLEARLDAAVDVPPPSPKRAK